MRQRARVREHFRRGNARYRWGLDSVTTEPGQSCIILKGLPPQDRRRRGGVRPHFVPIEYDEGSLPPNMLADMDAINARLGTLVDWLGDHASAVATARWKGPRW